MGFGDIAKRRPDRIQYSDGLFCFVTLLQSSPPPPLALFILTYLLVSGCDFTKLENVLNLQNVFVRVCEYFSLQLLEAYVCLFIRVEINMTGTKSISKNVSAGFV